MAGTPDIARDLSTLALRACEKEGLPPPPLRGRTVHSQAAIGPPATTK
jgi:hypothetical protein